MSQVVVAAVAVLLVGTVIGAVVPDGDSSPSQSRNEDSVEYKLAVVDEGGFVAPDDPVVDSYATLLDFLEPKCNENRERIGDMAVVAKDELGTSLLTILRGVNGSIPTDFGSQPCADIFAYYVALQQ